MTVHHICPGVPHGTATSPRGGPPERPGCVAAASTSRTGDRPSSTVRAASNRWPVCRPSMSMTSGPPSTRWSKASRSCKPSVPPRPTSSTSASTALDLSRIKKFTGTGTGSESNENLLQPSPTNPTVLQVNGVPISVVPDGVIDPGVVWLSDKARSYIILKRAVPLDVSREAFFTADAVAVKATVRLGFGYPSESGFVRIAAGEGSSDPPAQRRRFSWVLSNPGGAAGGAVAPKAPAPGPAPTD